MSTEFKRALKKMLEGWYCRTLANEQSTTNQDDPTDPNVDVNGDDSGSDDSFEQDLPREKANNTIDYKSQYRYLKRKFKFLIYENEFFQDALRINQRRLLKVSRDRAFLLDRLLQYEKPENTSSESDETESSDDETVKDAKKRKLEQSLTNTTVASTRGRKKKSQTSLQTQNKCSTNNSVAADALTAETQQLKDERGQMISADLEKNLRLNPPLMQSYTERASETVPHEMFSNEPSLDSESNDHLIDGSSPTHVAAEECVPMEYSNN